jgi:hypothetical protein
MRARGISGEKVRLLIRHEREEMIRLCPPPSRRPIGSEFQFRHPSGLVDNEQVPCSG